MRLARERGATVLALTNIMGSQATRDADAVLFTRAGLEIGVAATKTFSSQVAAMYLLGLWLAQARGTLEPRSARRADRRAEGAAAPDRGDDRRRSTSACAPIARSHARPALLPLPRPQHRPAGLPRGRAEDEGDLLHPDRRLRGRRDEARADRAARRVDTPVVCVATDSPVLEKVLSNVAEVRARGADVIAIATEGTDAGRRGRRPDALRAAHRLGPAADPRDPAAAAARLPHRPRCNGLNVDQPRNLAKTVTVE